MPDLHPRYAHFHDMQPQWLDDPQLAELDVCDAMQYAIDHEQIKSYAKELPLPVPRGLTICLLENENMEPVAIGYAFCSTQDNFCRKIGRQISLSRATKAVQRGDTVFK